MSVRRSKMFIAAFIASVALLAAGGFAAIYEHSRNGHVCECEGG